MFDRRDWYLVAVFVAMALAATHEQWLGFAMGFIAAAALLAWLVGDTEWA